MIKSIFYLRATSFILTLALCFTIIIPGGALAAGDQILFEQDFDTITDLSQETTLSFKHNSEANSSAKLADGALVFGKSAKGATSAEFDMAASIGDAADYAVDFDLKLATGNSTAVIRLGACIALRPSGGKYTVEYHDSSAWVTDDTTTYDFAKGLKVKFVVKEGALADLYIDNVLVRSDIPRRAQNSVYLFTKLGFELSNSLTGDMTIDNLRAYIPGDEPEPDPVVYSQDFSDISSLDEDSLFAFDAGENTTAYATVEEEALSVGKTTSGGVKLELDFASKTASDTYLVSMDMAADFNVGYTVNIRLGSTVALRSAGDGMYTVEYNDGSGWITSDTTQYYLERGATIRFVVKDSLTTDMYIGNKLVKADIPRRYSQPFTTLGFDLGNSMKGSFTLDNIFVTTDTTIETVPEQEPPQQELPENAVSSSDVPTKGAPSVEKEDFDLYLAIGQSNMAGRADMETEDRIFLPDTYLLNGDDEWETAQAQYVNGKWCGFNRYSTVRKTDAIQGLSPAFYFAKTLSEADIGENKKIGIISNARGDTSIEAWQKGYTSDSNDYDLYEEAVRRTKTAMETGTLRGIIWHQGCANISSDPDAYIEKFATLVEDLRTDLGADVPVIIGEIPGFGADSSRIRNRMNFNKNCIARIPGFVDDCYTISSAGSRDIGDKTHFDNASQKRMGKLYGEAALEVIYGFEKEELKAVPLVNVSGGDTAYKAADGEADIHAWADAGSLWQGAEGDVFTAEFVCPVTVKEIKSYFCNPYNYVVRYKLYLICNDGPVLVADNSSATSYPFIGADGAVVDYVDNIYAQGISVEITGGLDIDGEIVSDIIGCHEFEVKTADSIPTTNVSFVGFSGRGEISVQDADKLTLKADSLEGIKEIEVYFNGTHYVTLTEASYEIDISALGVSTTLIKAVAISNSNEIAEAELELVINNRFLSATFEDSDFELDSSSKTTSGIALNSQRGYVKTGVIDEEHGTSLLVGMDTVNDEFTSGSLPFINMPLGGRTDKFTLTCDLYVSEKDTSGDKKLTVYQKSGVETVLVQFKANASSGSKSFGYETKTWYAMRFDIDVAAGTFDSYVDGELVVSGAKLANGFETANYIRLYGQRNDNVKAFTAIDNIKILMEHQYPAVLSVGDEGMISHESGRVEIVLDRPLKRDTLTRDNVSIVRADGAIVPVEEIICENGTRITVVSGGNLSSNTEYTVIFSSDVRLEDGVAISVPLKVKFKTEMQGMEITDADFGYEAGEKTCLVSLYNSSSQEETAFVVMTLWRGSEFAGMDVARVSSEGLMPVEVSLSVPSAGDTRAEVYIYKSLAVPVFTGGCIYSE